MEDTALRPHATGQGPAVHPDGTSTVRRSVGSSHPRPDDVLPLVGPFKGRHLTPQPHPGDPAAVPSQAQRPPQADRHPRGN